MVDAGSQEDLMDVERKGLKRESVGNRLRKEVDSSGWKWVKHVADQKAVPISSERSCYCPGSQESILKSKRNVEDLRVRRLR
jgi:hypothetical protein